MESEKELRELRELIKPRELMVPRVLMEPRYLMDRVVDVHVEYEVAYLEVYPTQVGNRSTMVSFMGCNV